MADLRHDFFDMLMDSQWWSSAALDNYKRSQLTHLLIHAKANTPFYESRLDSALKPGGDVDWDRWAEIPVVTRQDMIDHRVQMQARVLPSGHGPAAVVTTSGSTSLPIEITTNALVDVAGAAAQWRGQSRNNVDWARNLARRLGSGSAPLVPPYGELRGQWGPPWTPVRGEFWELNVKLPAETVLGFLRDYECEYLNTGAAPAHVFALEAERLGIEPPRLDAIITQGASVGQADRDACLRVFGARMLDAYSSREGGQIAHPCELGTLHINTELCFLEVVDTAGFPVSDGTSGRLVVTPFFSTAQPLIRYDQGDIGHLGSRCSCGRAGPTLGALEGRHSIFFSHPDGRMATSLLPEYAREVLDCTFWQVAQIGPISFEVRYVPRSADRYGNEDEFVRIFRSQYFEDADVKLRRVAEIPLTASGKYVEYRIEMPGV